jgi:hypothetical protein
MRHFLNMLWNEWLPCVLMGGMTIGLVWGILYALGRYGH